MDLRRKGGEDRRMNKRQEALMWRVAKLLEKMSEVRRLLKAKKEKEK